MLIPEEKFWMVVDISDPRHDRTVPCEIPSSIPAGQAPRYLHLTRETAEVECLRLRSAHEGIYVVMESVATHCEGVENLGRVVYRLVEMLRDANA